MTHGLGTAAAIVATTLFLASTLYHAIHHHASKVVLKRIDHSAIYLLIAGSYTPFMSISLKSAASYMMLIVVWGLALAGVVFKIYFLHRFERLSLITYLIMGWLATIMAYGLWQEMPRAGFNLLVAGGICYTVGAVFYAMQKVRYSHAIWHLWVIAGAVCHCVSIGVCVIPPV